MKREDYIPAPIDNKNISTDWIELVFDNYDMVCGGKKDNIYMGFVDNIPCIGTIYDNNIEWRLICDKPDYHRLEVVLNSFENDEDSVFSDIEVTESGIFQSFYFAPEE